MRVQELVERMMAGEPGATIEVRRRFSEGDSDVTREIGRRLAAGDSELGKRLMATEEDPAVEAPDTFQGELLQAKDLTTSKPGTTGPLMEELEARARRLGTCQTVQVLGMNARRLTLVGDLVGAREALARARAEAGDCRACDLDILRREALLLLHLGEKAKAFRKSQDAMDGYEAFGAPGHDLNGNGRASSLIARAQIRFELGDKAGSAADFGTALRHFPRASKVWKVTHQNLACTVAQLGPAEQRQVSKELTSLRLSMRRVVSVERAAFLWFDGQLLVAAGDDRRSRRDRGLDRLIKAMELYRHRTIAMPRPWLGVGSDIARVLFPDRREIGIFLDRQVHPYADGLVKAEIHRRQLKALSALCEARPMAPAESVRRCIESLREAAGAAMPCLLPPWPVRVPG